MPISELQDYADLGVLRERLDALYDSYRQSLYEDRRYVLNRYRYHDTARKVVGVGSVGTRAWVSILTGRGLDDPLMLQMKEPTSRSSNGSSAARRMRRMASVWCRGRS